jgi:hypothetical protein
MTVSVPLRFHSICYFPIYAPVGSRLPGPCAYVLISALHMYSRSPCAPPSVVLICFTFRTRYTVSYITCIVIYPVPQSEYRICSPFDTFNSPLVPSPSVLPRAGLVNAGFASSSDTVGKPLAPRSSLIPSFLFPQARNITVG